MDKDEALAAVDLVYEALDKAERKLSKHVDAIRQLVGELHDALDGEDEDEPA